MNEQILGAGLSDEQISSRANSSSSFGFEAINADIPDFTIPMRYWRDSLKVLPVNAHTVFVYWELTNNLLEQWSVKLPLILNLFDEKNNHLTQISILQDVGSSYLNASWSEKKLNAQIGFINDGGDFQAILSSNKVKMPSDRLHIINSETWMSKSEQYEEIIKASLEGNLPSSSSIAKQMQMAFYDARLNSLSSFNIANQKEEI